MWQKLTDADKSALEQVAGHPNGTLARRATIILLSEQGLPLSEIARKAGCSVRTAQRWQSRFQEKGMEIFPKESLDSKPATEPDLAGPATLASQAEAPAKKRSKKKGAKKGGAAPAYPVREAIGVKPDDSLAEAGRKVLGFHFARMLNNEAGTRQGEDIEALHDMRVATRRMRAAMRVFGHTYSKKSIKPLRSGLKATGRALGRVRDLDVFMEKLQSYQQTLPAEEQAGLQPLLDAWQLERQQAREEMLAYLNGKAYARFKKSLLEFVETEGMGAKPIPAGVPLPYQLRHVAPGLIYARYEAVHAYEVVLENASLETLHQLRITFKELRYVLEFFREILGEEREVVISEVKKLQNHLGDLNDAHVAGGLLQDFLARWEEKQLHLPLAERQNPTQIAAYLNLQLNEQHRLMVTFPEVWERFNNPGFRRNLALSISVL